MLPWAETLAMHLFGRVEEQKSRLFLTGQLFSVSSSVLSPGTILLSVDSRVSLCCLSLETLNELGHHHDVDSSTCFHNSEVCENKIIPRGEREA